MSSIRHISASKKKIESITKKLTMQSHEAHEFHMRAVSNHHEPSFDTEDIPPLIEYEEKESKSFLDFATVKTRDIILEWTREKGQGLLEAISEGLPNQDGLLDFWVCNSNPRFHTLSINTNCDSGRDYQIEIDGALEIERLVQSFVGYSNWTLVSAHNRTCHLETDTETMCRYCGWGFK